MKCLRHPTQARGPIAAGALTIKDAEVAVSDRQLTMAMVSGWFDFSARIRAS